MSSLQLRLRNRHLSLGLTLCDARRKHYMCSVAKKKKRWKCRFIQNMAQVPDVLWLGGAVLTSRDSHPLSPGSAKCRSGTGSLKN